MRVDVEQAQASLKELIAKTALGETVLIMDGRLPVAELVSVRQ